MNGRMTNRQVRHPFLDFGAQRLCLGRLFIVRAVEASSLEADAVSFGLAMAGCLGRLSVGSPASEGQLYVPG